MKEIEFIIGTLEIGGAERHLTLILPELKKRGFKVSVRVLSDKARLKPLLEKAGVRVKTSIGLNPLPPLLRRPCRLMLSLGYLLGDFLFKKKIIRHAFLPEAYLLTAIVKKIVFSKDPLIMSRRSLNDYKRRRPLLGKLENLFRNDVALALANSQAVAEQLYAEGFDRAKVRLIYNGIDLDKFERLPTKKLLREKFSLPNDNLIFIIVANLIPYKGHADLLAAFALIRDRLTRPWKLLCVGQDNGILKTLKEQAIAAKIDANVSFQGSREDAAELMGAADIGILCSHEEGFSNAILEGMAAGLAMVVTDVGGNAEAVLDKRTGLVVPPKNPESLGQALLTLAMEDDTRELFQANAKERARTNFSLDKCAERYERVYKTFTENGELNP